MQSSQWLLDALGNQGWNAATIKGQLKLMSSMIEEHNAGFKGIWFSGFVRMGQEGPLEMIATRKVCAVSNGEGVSKCLNIITNVLFTLSFVTGFYERLCTCCGSCKQANHSGWRDVISSANDLLTHRDLGRFANLCNNGYKSMKSEITSTRIGIFCSLDTLHTLGSGMGSRVMKKLKGATT
jgi:hypothetical protein